MAWLVTDQRAELIGQLRVLAAAHGPIPEVMDQAARRGVRRLVLAHIGRPAIAALDAGHLLPFGEIGVEGGVCTVHGPG